jgi:hypothetical protein
VSPYARRLVAIGLVLGQGLFTVGLLSIDLEPALTRSLDDVGRIDDQVCVISACAQP